MYKEEMRIRQIGLKIRSDLNKIQTDLCKMAIPVLRESSASLLVKVSDESKPQGLLSLNDYGLEDDYGITVICCNIFADDLDEGKEQGPAIDCLNSRSVTKVKQVVEKATGDVCPAITQI